MTNNIEAIYPIISFNYVIVFFTTLILLYFFFTIIFKFFSDKHEFDSILYITDKIYVKFNYNGIILDCNDNFAKITTLDKKDTIGQDIFDLLYFDNYEELSNALFSDINNKKNQYISKIKHKNEEAKTYNLKGFQNNNFLGAGVTYVLIGNDITSNEYIKRESEYNKLLLEKITNEYRFSQEEIKRNYDQIESIQNLNNAQNLQHKYFMDNLPLRTFEFNFNSRKLIFSESAIKFFIPNTYTKSVFYDDVLLAFYSLFDFYILYDFLEQFYNAIENKLERFTVSADLKNKEQKLTLSGFIQYDNNAPEYMFVIIKEI